MMNSLDNIIHGAYRSYVNLIFNVKDVDIKIPTYFIFNFFLFSIITY